MHEFDMNLIKPFIKVYEFNSFTKAANDLDVSQPAISASIKRLEDHLGYPLFIRSGRNLTATTSAHQFYLQISSVIDVVDNALTHQQRFIVNAPESILLKLIDLPDIQLIEAGNDEEETLNELRMRKIDLAIENTTQKDNGFCFESIYEEDILLVCCQSHPTIQGKITLDQYRESGHVAMKLLRHNMRAVEFLSKTPIMRDRNIKIQVSSPANMLLALQNTDYIAAIPEGLKEVAIALNLQILTPPFEVNSIHYQMIYHKRFMKDPIHQQLRNSIKAKLNNTLV
ncbi:LysR family transcriptional regulator [Psychromonas sp. RZ22]|uniref:LysR family transcriptional regulator n=1 Tax=Psychromonas algarum TaxID=2555643 RepID=UPI00106752CA|nr:LysR family transcriptional regulator [Psychromonas sp. RZ22]TEW54637.1 LysR family transcriptional regulator [Psychromonas sp. RZ22]